jgi:broad specificity phosphatase PhoE
MATLFLIRHGEPEVTGIFLGQLDVPLAAAGWAQMASALGGIAVAVAWCSPLRRARETAEAVRAEELRVVADLREIDQGEWTGKRWAEIEAGWSELAQRKSADWLGVAAPGGESWTDFLERVGAVWQLIRRGPRPAAVIAHQGVNAALAHLIDGRDPLAFAQQYGEVTSVEYD